MDLAKLKEIVPTAKDAWAIALISEMPAWHIDTPMREAAFLANVAHETRGLTQFEENLSYSAERIVRVWPAKFRGLQSADGQPDEQTLDLLALQLAREYAHNPRKLANKVYANRMGNGDEASDDGWRYRGRGTPMLTGRTAYRAFGHAIGQPIEENPDWLASVPKIGAQAGCWFWQWRGLRSLADAGDFEGVAVKWNGGKVGFRERVAIYEDALRALA